MVSSVAFNPLHEVSPFAVLHHNKELTFLWKGDRVVDTNHMPILQPCLYLDLGTEKTEGKEEEVEKEGYRTRRGGRERGKGGVHLTALVPSPPSYCWNCTRGTW